MQIHISENCPCGRIHKPFQSEIAAGSGAVQQLPGIIRRLGGTKAFVLADENTFAAAGETVCGVLNAAGIPYSSFVFAERNLHPDEHTVGSAVMHYDPTCDIVVSVGSGVLNDTGKILANITRHPYIIVGTAPSMDGYASATSSMDRDGLKVSLPSKCADAIIGDTDILKNAPMHMLAAGLGDMLAKYVSICEWRIAHIVTGEYYCEEVAALVRRALKCCVDNADGWMRRDPDAVAAVFEGLVIGGVAMNFAGVSRPASGVEHYFSHVWDMRALEFGLSADLHGIQCAAGTLLALKLYEQIRTITPDRAKALACAKNFDYPAWAAELQAFLGKGADTMIALEAKEHKYDPTSHARRLETILSRWDDICAIMDEELPPVREMESLLKKIGIPTLADMGIDEAILPMTFKATKDIRDKYVLSRLAWDLGVIDELRI